MSYFLMGYFALVAILLLNLVMMIKLKSKQVKKLAINTKLDIRKF